MCVHHLGVQKHAKLEKRGVFLVMLGKDMMKKLSNKAVLEPRVLPAFAITFFCIHCNILDLKIHQSMWIH